jgi:hypothetical protein
MTRIAYIIFGEKTNELLELGFKRPDGTFQGPPIHPGGGVHYLKEEFLALLVGRFVLANGVTSIRLLNEYELDRLGDSGEIPFDTPSLGEGRYWDPPLSKYLPELDTMDQKDMVVMD